MIRQAIAGAALLIGLSCGAAAQEAVAQPKLKELVTVTAETVRIGDLVENAGASADVAVFRAPDLGQTGTVQVARIVEALKAHDVTDIDAAGLSEVVVTRLSRAITIEDIQDRIARAVAGQHGFGEAGNLSVSFDREVRTLHIEAAATSDLLVARLNLESRSGRFDVSLEIPGSAAARRLPLRFTGTVSETIEAATLARNVTRGEVIREADVVIERRPKSEVGTDAIGADTAVGLSAKRPLRAGLILRRSDLVRADVVNRNEAVTIVFEAPGIMLTARGKALDAGAAGDLINVLNIQSKRTVQATIAGPGRVVAISTAPRVADAAAPSSNRRARAQ
jgi:flagellar basal body P-ring formation protein FlgA